MVTFYTTLYKIILKLFKWASSYNMYISHLVKEHNIINLNKKPTVVRYNQTVPFFVIISKIFTQTF